MSERVAIITNKSSLGRLGGIERAIEGLIEGLESRGVQALLIGPLEERPHFKGSVKSESCVTPTAIRLDASFLSELREISRMCDRLLLVPSARLLMGDVEPLGEELGRMRKPVVLDVLFPLEELDCYLTPELVSQVVTNLDMLSRICERIIVPSQFSERGLLRRLQPRCGVTTSPLGVSPRRKETSVPGRISCVSRSGRLAVHKNLDVLVESMALVISNTPKAQLIVVTPNGFASNEDSRIRTQVGLLDDEVSTIVASSVCSCLPSGIEAFGLSVLESMAEGVPPIVADAGALPELVQEDRNGIVVRTSLAEVRVGDRAVVLPRPAAADVGEAILRLLGDEQLRQRLGEQARVDASSYTWSRFAASHISR